MSELPPLGELGAQSCATKVSGPQDFQLSTYVQRVNLDNPAQDHCGCKGFSFRRDCKHIREARELAAASTACGWAWYSPDLSQTPQQAMEMVCPKCGGETEYVEVKL